MQKGVGGMKCFRLPAFRLVTAWIFACQLFAIQALAQWSTSPDTNNAICTERYTEYNPAIASDGAGGAIITWEDSRTFFDWDIYTQRINALGAVQWTTNGVAISTAAFPQEHPTIVSDGAGGAIITWQDRRAAGVTDVYAQRINASGAVQWSTQGVPISTAVSFQSFPVIASDGAGGAIIAWQDYRRGDTYYDMYAQRINAAGVVQWTADGVAISTAGYDQRLPAIVSDGAGGAIITWEDTRVDPGYGEIYAQRINAAGVVQWTINGVVICNAGYDQLKPTIASDGAGGAIITWENSRSNFELDIYAQRINDSGVVQWTASGVAISTVANDQRRPTIVSDGAGGAIITWEDSRSGTGYFDIYAQRINAAGVVQWTANGAAISTPANDQLKPTIASDGTGGAIITWYDRRDGTYEHIYAQRISASGVVQWTANGVAISTALQSQYYPVIVSAGAGGAIITWEDSRNGNDHDLYAQQVNANGQLGVVTEVRNDVAALPESFRLEQNYPNPFNPVTNFQFSIANSQLTILKVYDVLGREVATLVNEVRESGMHIVQWNAGGVASGVYFYRIQAGSFVETKKLLVLR
jgi:hypothetical protein